MSEDKQKNPRLEFKGISKYFGATRALHDMNITLYEGEIIGLIGPNGAGKTTLMKILTGVYSPSEGEIFMDGSRNVTHNYDTTASRAEGVACVYQELSLCTNLSIYENFMLTNVNHNKFTDSGWRKKNKKSAREALDNIFPNNGLDVTKNVEDYSLGERQMVEIARAMSYDGLRILILDEPTSSLTIDRIEQLHDAMRKLSAKGVSIIYVSHKLEEIKKITDRIIVMKNGESTLDALCKDISTEEIIVHLGGNTAAKNRTREQYTGSETPIVKVKNINTRKLKNVSMELKEGEILGIGGLEGAGQKPLLREIFHAGMKHGTKQIEINKRVAFISGDRQTEGVFKLWHIADNTLISSLDNITEHGLINTKKADSLAQEWFDKLKFKAKSKYDPIVSLSGGNQQKAIIARGIASEADIIILDDPTRGVDIETKQEIYKLLNEAKKSGKSIIWYSTEDTEMEQCDRVYVMRFGEISKELSGDLISVGNIVKASFEDNHDDSGKEENGEAASKKENKFLNTLKVVGTTRWTLPVITFAVIYLLNIMLNPKAMSEVGVNFLFGAAVPLVLLALAQMFIALCGDIDMGIGSAMGLVNVIMATMMVQKASFGILSLILLIVGYAAMGALIHTRKIPAIVVTLGASFIWLGIALMIQPTPGGSAPDWLTGIFNFSIGIIPMPIIICVIAALVTYFIVKRSKYGVILRGIGNNPSAIENSGWSYFGAHVTIYVIAAIFIILAGAMFTAISSGSDANATSSFTMNSVATIMLGGCEFSGGIGEPVGVVVGGVAISLISSLLAFMSVSSDYQTAVVGIILLAALASRLLFRKRVD